MPFLYDARYSIALLRQKNMSGRLGIRLNSVDSTEFSLSEKGRYVVVPDFGDLILFGRVPQ